VIYKCSRCDVEFSVAYRLLTCTSCGHTKISPLINDDILMKLECCGLYQAHEANLPSPVVGENVHCTRCNKVSKIIRIV